MSQLTSRLNVITRSLVKTGSYSRSLIQSRRYTTSSGNAGGGKRQQQQQGNSNNDPAGDGGSKKSSLYWTLTKFGLAGGVIGGAYYLLHDRDYMFSSELPTISRDSLDRFKSVMAQHKGGASQPQSDGDKEKEKEEKGDTEIETIGLVVPNPHYQEQKEHREQNEKAKEEGEALKEEEVREEETTQGEPVEEIRVSNPQLTETLEETKPVQRVVDEINQEEADLDRIDEDEEENKVVASEEGDKITDEMIMNTVADIIDSKKIELVDEIVKFVEKERKEEEERQGAVEEEKEEVDVSQHKAEEIWKKIEEQYLNKIHSLLTEKIELTNEIERIKNSNREWIESVENDIKAKYQETLDRTLETLNKEFGERVSELDRYLKDNVEGNLQSLQSTITKQKENLVHLFEEQADSIRRSEFEKKLISQLTSSIVDLRKVLMDASDPEKKVISQAQIARLIDLCQYDKMLKPLADKLPSKQWLENGVKDLTQLKEDFQTLSKECRRISLIDPNDDSLLGKIVSGLAVNFIVPSEQGKEDETDPTLIRAEKYLRAGNLPQAIKEVESVGKKTRQLDLATRAWLRSARDRDQLENLTKLLEMKLDLLNQERATKTQK